MRLAFATAMLVEAYVGAWPASFPPLTFKLQPCSEPVVIGHAHRFVLFERTGAPQVRKMDSALQSLVLPARLA